MTYSCAGQLNILSMLDATDTLENCIERFKNREVKAKDVFSIMQIDKALAYAFVSTYHYLGKAEFFAKYAFGLWCCGELVGVATYSNPQGTTALQGWFGLGNDDQSVLELSRLAMLPILNGTNATSFFLSGSIRELKRFGVRAVITLADASRHIGSIYQVCNFKYYGLANDKQDFFRYPDCKKNPRGKVKEVQGVWLPRTKKHRYAYIMDKRLKCCYSEQKAPSKKYTIGTICCGGGLEVYDNRFEQWYSCPVCTGRLVKIEHDQTAL